MLAELEDRVRQDRANCTYQYAKCITQGLDKLAEYWDGRRKSMTGVLRWIEEIQGVTGP